MRNLTHLIALDQQLSARFALSCEARFLRLLALVIAHSGDSPLWLLGAATAIIWGNITWQSFGWRVLVGTLVTGTVITLLKWFFRRQRPPGDGRGFYTRFDRHAFPSGHAGRSACMIILLTPFIPSTWGRVLLPLWVGLVGLARIALQVHFVSDIVGGWTVGLLVGLTLQMAL
jgi:undecaprenyl-diphosphatase